MQLIYVTPAEPIPVIAEILSSDGDTIAEIQYRDGKCVLHIFEESSFDLEELMNLFSNHYDRLKSIALFEYARKEHQPRHLPQSKPQQSGVSSTMPAPHSNQQ